MPKGYPLKKMTVEEIEEHVKATIPYVVGRGTECVVGRGREMKRLMGIHGHDTDKFGRFHLVVKTGGGNNNTKVRYKSAGF